MSSPTRLTVAAFLMAAAAACGPTTEVRARLATLDTVSAQKDSLLTEVALQARLLSDITAELAQVQMRDMQVTSESPGAAQRDTLVQKVRFIVARVGESERRIRESQRRIRSLTHINDSLRTTLDATLANLQDVIETQKTTIATLTASIDTLQVNNAALSTQVVALKDTVAVEHTVFYVIGTRQELKEKGIVVEEGGSRVLFVLWRTGETLAPARNLDPSYFAAIDRQTTTEIPLPHADGRYRVVSRNDLTALATPRDEGGRITGTSTLQIADPVAFWRGARFLIIVQESPSGQQAGADD